MPGPGARADLDRLAWTPVYLFVTARPAASTAHTRGVSAPGPGTSPPGKGGGERGPGRRGHRGKYSTTILNDDGSCGVVSM